MVMNPQDNQTSSQHEVQELDFYSRLGIATLLMEQSPYHKQWPLYDAELELVPPLHLNQCKFYFDPQQNPVAFVTWSSITEATKNKLVNESGQMQWDDWNSGELLLFNDFVAPFGHTREILKDLRNQEWPHKIAFSLRRTKDGSVKKVNYWWHQKDYKQHDLGQRRQGLQISV
jgi:cytolysin-activating lysine-acyltransferase